MSDLSSRIYSAAKALILAAGTAHAVAATDIQSQAHLIVKSYGTYSQNQIANKISDEIKKTHAPGVSGSM
ncbi:hypothetical protein Csp2054_09190 [Curtobacterium sp. 'Ferrero']|uniref:hypothetical protein n=1 Tax=Curtobacterium sp. 'Ferrero' TaxID=2033654 RepID=UPI000BD5D354|nr:hypothetical protein [Curtobacterium sp. 'Ferrero']PCN48038.1 hypothetical protein Csp2054_09190 [Curtobacterium sp. 'Ferrero']